MVLKVKGNRAILVLPKNTYLDEGGVLRLSADLEIKVIKSVKNKVLVLLSVDQKLRVGDTFSLEQTNLQFKKPLDIENNSNETSKKIATKIQPPPNMLRLSIGIGLPLSDKLTSTLKDSFGTQVTLESKNIQKDLLFSAGFKITSLLFTNFIYQYLDGDSLFDVQAGLHSNLSDKINPFVFFGLGFWSAEVFTSIGPSYSFGLGVELYPTKHSSISPVFTYQIIPAEWPDDISVSIKRTLLHIQAKFYF